MWGFALDHRGARAVLHNPTHYRRLQAQSARVQLQLGEHQTPSATAAPPLRPAAAQRQQAGTCINLRADAHQKQAHILRGWVATRQAACGLLLP